MNIFTDMIDRAAIHQSLPVGLLSWKPTHLKWIYISRRHDISSKQRLVNLIDFPLWSITDSPGYHISKYTHAFS